MPPPCGDLSTTSRAAINDSATERFTFFLVVRLARADDEVDLVGAQPRPRARRPSGSAPAPSTTTPSRRVIAAITSSEPPSEGSPPGETNEAASMRRNPVPDSASIQPHPFRNRNRRLVSAARRAAQPSRTSTRAGH